MANQPDAAVPGAIRAHKSVYNLEEVRGDGWRRRSGRKRLLLLLMPISLVVLS